MKKKRTLQNTDCSLVKQKLPRLITEQNLATATHKREGSEYHTITSLAQLFSPNSILIKFE